MNMTFETHENISLIELQENLTMSNAHDAREQLIAHVGTEVMGVLLNMKEVGFIDSSGLAVLVQLYKKIKERDGRIALLQPSANVKALLELTRLNELLDIYDDKDIAMADLKGAA